MNYPIIFGDNEETRNYVSYLEKIIGGASNLQKQLAIICDVLASDLEILSQGKTEGLVLLSSDKDDKSFERLFMVIKNKTDLISLSQFGTTTEETTTKTVKKKTNLQDFVLKK